MNPLSILRDYQREAIEDLFKRWDAGSTRVPMVLATGLGKTKIGTRAVWQWLEQNRGKRVLWLAHTDELISQAAREMRQANPDARVGIVKAAQNETTAQIICSSRQTLASERRRAQIKNVGLIIIDEAHHAVRSNTYGKILEHFGAFDENFCQECIDASDQVSVDVGYEVRGNYCPNAGCRTMSPKVLGLTATLQRSDRSKLSSVWEEVTFKRDILFGIRRGYLLDVRGERVEVPDLDLGDVKVVRGDFSDAALGAALDRTFATGVVAEQYAKSARKADGGLRLGIAFWPLVETAHHAASAFEEQGIPSAVVHGGLPREERRLILERFHAGEITVVHNCMVLTEGFDEPRADVVVIGRPTKSAPLYQQMVGRVLRPDLEIPAEQREKALILDVTGAGATNDLRSLIDLSPELAARGEYDDDLSLLELDEELNPGGSIELDTVVYNGPATTVAFDPLHRSMLWAQTPGGTYWMSAGSDGYVFLGETRHGEPGEWDVVWCSKRDWGAPPQQVASTQYVALSLEDALLFAEEEAIERGGFGAKTLAQKNSRWRRGVPSGAILRKAKSVGAVVHDGATMGDVSEAINAKIAAKSIDHLVRR